MPDPLARRIQEIENIAKVILQRHQIDGDVDIELQNVGLENQPKTRVPTLSIVAPWNVETQNRWEEAVREIVVKLHYMFKDTGYRYENIHVDMQASFECSESPSPFIPSVSTL
ncbi:hypothetical protein FLONG3_5777 [Fusarium longipes]|uniref:Uncharacterized protein n=1 Tax=Fusarium longipes TaxID=694270 RepID=A0A395SRK9_9HYPO|nr:hypothetical protein FLONG3_5777 [Fusarium longipes]